MVKNPPVMWETWVRSLCCEDLEEGVTTHSSILAWGIQYLFPGAWWATIHGVSKS